MAAAHDLLAAILACADKQARLEGSAGNGQNVIHVSIICRSGGATTVLFWTKSDLASLLRCSQSGQVGEWLKPTDCKSVPPCEVRRFESFPVHHETVCRCSSVGRALPW